MASAAAVAPSSVLDRVAQWSSLLVPTSLERLSALCRLVV
jgi:hypothetical protein